MEVEAKEGQRKIEVSYSPALFPVYYSSRDCVVVIIDVFRATSAICTAFEHGVERIIPVASVEEAKEYKSRGFLTAAERQGEMVEGFDFGNSPFSYMKPEVKGKVVVLTTTNGTKAIHRAKAADRIVIGSFLNISALCDYLIACDKDVLLLCAGWRDRFNLEDTLFAGAVTSRLNKLEKFSGLADSAIAAKALYEMAEGNLNDFLKDSSHRRRLARLNLERDIEYCLRSDITSIVPIFKGNALEPVKL